MSYQMAHIAGRISDIAIAGQKCKQAVHANFAVAIPMSYKP